MLTTLKNPYGAFFLNTYPWIASWGTLFAVTVDATNEISFLIGHIVTEDGQPKTLSSGSGKILWKTHTNAQTFADSSTRLVLGLTGVESTGFPATASFITSATLSPGTHSLASNTYYETVLDSGSTTVSSGDLVGIGAHLAVRGGVDAVHLAAYGSSGTRYLPYRVTGVTTKTTSTHHTFGVQFDDGTFGWISPAIPPYSTFAASLESYSTSTTYDEYGIAFKVPVQCGVQLVRLNLGSISSTDTYTLRLFSDPFGTPTQMTSLTPSPSVYGNSAATTQEATFVFPTMQTMQPDTWYVVSVRATSINQVGMAYYTIPSASYKAFSDFGRDFDMVRRDGDTGAFQTFDSLRVPHFGIAFSQLAKGTEEFYF